MGFLSKDELSAEAFAEVLAGGRGSDSSGAVCARRAYSTMGVASSDLVLPEGALPAALDALPYGIVVIDKDHRVMYAYEPAYRLAADDLRIGVAARWASIQQPSFGRAIARRRTRAGPGSSEISAVTILGRSGGMVRPMRVLRRWPRRRAAGRVEPFSDRRGRGRDPEQQLAGGRSGVEGRFVELGRRGRRGHSPPMSCSA